MRSLFPSFLLALILLTSISAAPADARSKPKAAHTVAAKKKRKRKPKKAVFAVPATPAVCPNTTLVPDAGNLDLIRGALSCLHDQVRSRRGLGTLADNAALDAAAAAHSDDMIARDYFDHSTPDGGTFDKRILAAGYAQPDDGWRVGENLIWATSELSTPAALMNAWMNSEGHRENILNPYFRDLGLGVRLGTPTGDPTGVTVSAEFGTRD